MQPQHSILQLRQPGFQHDIFFRILTSFVLAIVKSQLSAELRCEDVIQIRLRLYLQVEVLLTYKRRLLRG